MDDQRWTNTSSLRLKLNEDKMNFDAEGTEIFVQKETSLVKVTPVCTFCVFLCVRESVSVAFILVLFYGHTEYLFILHSSLTQYEPTMFTKRLLV